ncbi:MAG: hypothetical protein PVF73_03650 [Bacteroidales bacterium]|jgi:hypothetical protein
MRELLQKTIDELKFRVKKNLKVINENQMQIKQLLASNTSGERAAEYEKCYSVNKRLLQENNDYINIQLTLINFLEKYKGTAVLDDEIPVVDIYSISDEVEVLDLTIKGVVKFDEKHPKYNNILFIDKMISRYESMEEYEKCQRLIELKKKMK